MWIVLPMPSAGGACDAHLLLDPLGSGLADQEVVVSSHVADDRLVHLVAAGAHGGGVGESAQAEHRDLGGAAADVHDHAADRFGDGHVGADRSGHRLLDQEHLARARIAGGVADRAAFHLGRARGHADHDLGPARELAGAVHLLDEMLDHLLGDVDVGDDAVAKRSDRLDGAGSLAHHQLGVVADRLDALDPVQRLDRDHRRLVQHDAATADIDHRVRGAEVDRHVVAHEFEEAGKSHRALVSVTDTAWVREARRRPCRQAVPSRVPGVAGCVRLV